MPLVPRKQQSAVLVQFKPRLGGLYRVSQEAEIAAACSELSMPQTYTPANDKGELADKVRSILADRGVDAVIIQEDVFTGGRYHSAVGQASSGPIEQEKLLLDFASSDEDGKPLNVRVIFDLHDRTGLQAAQKFQQITPGETVSLSASTRLETRDNKVYANKSVHVRVKDRDAWQTKDGQPSNYVTVPDELFRPINEEVKAARLRATDAVKQLGLTGNDAIGMVSKAGRKVELNAAIELAKMVEAKGVWRNGQVVPRDAASSAPSGEQSTTDEEHNSQEPDYNDGGDFELPPDVLNEIEGAGQKAALRG